MDKQQEQIAELRVQQATSVANIQHIDQRLTELKTDLSEIDKKLEILLERRRMQREEH